MCTLLNFTAFFGQLSINTISAIQQPKGGTQLFSVTGLRQWGEKSKDKELRNIFFHTVTIFVSLPLPSPVPLYLKHMTLYEIPRFQSIKSKVYQPEQRTDRQPFQPVGPGIGHVAIDLTSVALRGGSGHPGNR